MRVLQPGEGQHSVDPDRWTFVLESVPHADVDPVIQRVVNLCAFAQVGKEFCDKLTHPEPNTLLLTAVNLDKKGVKKYIQLIKGRTK